MSSRKKSIRPRVVRFTEEDTELLKELNSESNRGIALLAATILDNALQELLNRTVLAVSDGDDKRNKVRDWLFDRGPLQSFFAKIEFTYLIGGIDADTQKALHILRKLRNDFAHNMQMSFDDSQVKSQISSIGEILFPKAEPQEGDKLLKKLSVILYRMAEKEKKKGTRDFFDFCVVSLQRTIIHQIDNVRINLDGTRPTIYDYLRRSWL